jgi:hypothetical protein
MIIPSIIVLVTTGLTVTSGAGLAFNQRVPRWLFAIGYSWWWPFRQDDVASLLALDLDTDESCSQWNYNRIGWQTLTSQDGKFQIVCDGMKEGRYRITIRDYKVSGGVHDVRATVWGDQKLYRAIGRWKRRRNTSSKSVEVIEDKKSYNRALKATSEHLLKKHGNKTLVK